MKRTKTFSLRIDEALLSAVRQEARRREQSVGGLFRLAMRKYLAREGGESEKGQREAAPAAQSGSR